MQNTFAKLVVRKGSASASSALGRRAMSSKLLVVAEHDQKEISAGSLSTITAALKIGGEVSVLVVGKDVATAAAHASTVDKIAAVYTLEHDSFAHSIIAETFAVALADIAKEQGYTHVLTPATNSGKNFLPRAAALCDSAPLSDVLSVLDSETFTRPMYAGNAIATVKVGGLTLSLSFISLNYSAYQSM
jgi:electron transfer flavoprotein alpha subunit